MAVNKEDAKVIMKGLKKAKDISNHDVISHTPSHIDIHITHAEASKKHALIKLLEIIRIDKSEIMAVGDSNNDLPLFEVAGYKIAMNNASEKLKRTADYVALSAEEDGLAQVIEEKILSKQREI